MHKHEVKMISKKPFMCTVDRAFLDCRDHNPSMNWTPDFLRKMLKQHPEWFDVIGLQV